MFWYKSSKTKITRRLGVRKKHILRLHSGGCVHRSSCHTCIDRRIDRRARKGQGVLFLLFYISPLISGNAQRLCSQSVSELQEATPLARAQGSDPWVCTVAGTHQQLQSWLLGPQVPLGLLAVAPSSRFRLPTPKPHFWSLDAVSPLPSRSYFSTWKWEGRRGSEWNCQQGRNTHGRREVFQFLQTWVRDPWQPTWNISSCLLSKSWRRFRPQTQAPVGHSYLWHCENFVIRACGLGTPKSGWVELGVHCNPSSIEESALSVSL